MVMAAITRLWHRRELARLPDDQNRYEVLDGRLLVTPQASYAHQRVAYELGVLLGQYVGVEGVGHVVGPGAIPFGSNELNSTCASSSMISLVLAFAIRNSKAVPPPYGAITAELLNTMQGRGRANLANSRPVAMA